MSPREPGESTIVVLFTRDLRVHDHPALAEAARFFNLLVDGDIANNAGNWQWVAGTGNDTRPNRVFNPVRQAERFEQDGEYVKRWVPELAALPGARVHTPWRLDPADRRRLDYPPCIVSHAAAAGAAFRRRRQGVGLRRPSRDR